MGFVSRSVRPRHGNVCSCDITTAADLTCANQTLYRNPAPNPVGPVSGLQTKECGSSNRVSVSALYKRAGFPGDQSLHRKDVRPYVSEHTFNLTQRVGAIKLKQHYLMVPQRVHVSRTRFRPNLIRLRVTGAWQRVQGAEPLRQ